MNWGNWNYNWGKWNRSQGSHGPKSEHGLTRPLLITLLFTGFRHIFADFGQKKEKIKKVRAKKQSAQ